MHRNVIVHATFTRLERDTVQDEFHRTRFSIQAPRAARKCHDETWLEIKILSARYRLPGIQYPNTSHLPKQFGNATRAYLFYRAVIQEPSSRYPHTTVVEANSIKNPWGNHTHGVENYDDAREAKYESNFRGMKSLR